MAASSVVGEAVDRLDVSRMKVTGRSSQWHVVTVSWDSHPPQRKAHLRTEKEVCFLMSLALSLVLTSCSSHQVSSQRPVVPIIAQRDSCEERDYIKLHKDLENSPSLD